MCAVITLSLMLCLNPKQKSRKDNAAALVVQKAFYCGTTGKIVRNHAHQMDPVECN